MQWLSDLAALLCLASEAGGLGTPGAHANAARSLAEEREVATRLDRFLVGFEHPAGRSRVPHEPPAGECTRVA